MHKRAFAILIASTALIAGCGRAGDANNSAGAANQAVVENSAAAQNETAPANGVETASAAAARAVRIGIDGEHGMDACHTQGRISGQDSVSVREAPGEAARELVRVEPGLVADLCESVPGWRGIVYRGAGDPERDCGTGENLPWPRPYAGPCRSGWVAEDNFEITAG